MATDALELLTRIGMETSLRYAMHMIMTASLVAEKRKSAEVEIQDIKKVYTLFIDVKRSTAFLMEYQGEFMYNELDNRGDESGSEAGTSSDDEDDSEGDDEGANVHGGKDKSDMEEG